MSVAEVQSLAMQLFDYARMKELRESAGLTQLQAAKRAKMSVSRWSDIESGSRTNVTVETMGRIAKAIGCESHNLLTKPKGK